MTRRPARMVIFSRHFVEYSFRYANAMARHCDVLLIVDAANAVRQWDITSLPKRARLTVLYADFRMRGRGLLSSLAILPRIIRYRPDFVHFEEIPDVVTPFQIAFCKLFARTILTVHDPLAHSGRDANLLSAVYTLRDFGRRRADRIIVHGPFCFDSLVRAYPSLKERTVTANHGVLMVPVDGFVESDPGSILFFGRMEQYKGLDVICEAVGLLISRGVKHKMTIAGRGSAMDELSKALSALPTVTLITRYVGPSETSRLFQSASVVVLPYRDATQSGVLSAAFGNHRPVVASRVGGLPDVVKDGINGLLVAPGDAGALADGLQRVLEDRALREKLTRGAAATAANELDWDRITDGIFENLSVR